MPERRKHKPVPLTEVFLKGVLVHNPVLVQLIGICPVAAVAVSLRAGALLAAVSSLIIIATHVAASAFLKNIVRWVRVAVYLLIGLAVIAPVGWLLEMYYPALRLTIGIYLPLLAANSLIALGCEKVAVRNNIKHSFLNAIAVSIGYSAVLLLTGFIRELMGRGEIFEKPVHFLPAAPGLLLPFGGFLVLGFMAAILKAFVMRCYPKYAKAMSVDIMSTGVTMKLKSEEDDIQPQPEPDTITVGMQTETAEPAHGSEPDDEADGGEKMPDNGAGAEVPDMAEPAANDPAVEEPAAQASYPAESEEPAAPPQEEQPDEVLTVNREEIMPAPGVQKDESVPAAPQEEALPAETGIPDADNIDLKLKELFAYLDELEKETKAGHEE